MTDLQSRLQAVLGDTYRIEKELGGGGMSRVFLAVETRLGRCVVIKVLPPEMSAGVNVERFEREIQLAASLQHPHVVPLLTAGSHDDLLYYVMPYIEGESLRAKLAREGELPIGQALRILRDVADALAYAHRHHVVHRDIKPDNVLISDDHALVTDFGVAKAVSDSTGEQSLTSLGVALGTPAYMSPEQASASPQIDHRADIYSLGALAYEMLCGRPPFSGMNPQQVLSAHVTQSPEPCTTHRTSVPPGLNELVMRCLAKIPADRWQRADELKTQFDVMATPSTGGVTPTGTQPVAAVTDTTTTRNHPLRVAVLFGLGAGLTLVIVYGLMIALGLPDWVFVGAVALLAVGLPIILVTGKHERERALAATTGLHVPTPVGLQKHFTWSKAILGGGLAFAALAATVVGFMGMRSMGIGPAATLASTGALSERELIVLAELENRTQDSALGSTVTELLRVSLSQSPFIRLVDPARLTESLSRMQQDPGTAIDERLALEIAEREGIKAVLSGDVVPLGDGFVISVRLLAADGTVLTRHQASARDANEIMSAIDGLTADLRERMGESLRTIRRTAPLDLVTTGSLDALRLYTQAQHAEIAGDDGRAIDLLDEAITADSTFAMAYRKLGSILANNFEQRARAVDALSKAYRFRDRLTDIERGYAVAMYHSRVTGETENVIAAYRTILDKYPNDFRALNNTGVAYANLNDNERALDFYKRALAVDSTWSPGFTNVAFVERALGQFDSAGATLDGMEARFPGNPNVDDARAGLAYAQRDYDSARRYWEGLLERERASLGWRGDLTAKLARVAATTGRLREARQRMAEAASILEQRGLAAERMNQELEAALMVEQMTPDHGGRPPSIALSQLQQLAVPDRPYELLVQYLVLHGDVGAARSVLTDMRTSGYADVGRGFERELNRVTAWVSLGDGDPQTALDYMRRGSEERGCLGCRLVDLARFYDAAGEVDSATAYLDRYVNESWRIPFVDGIELALSYRRLGELYESRNQVDKAVEAYNEFVNLWSEADPELQPQVTDVKNRIARLVGER